MPSDYCRSSGGCLELATAGTFGEHFCGTHFEEIDLIRRSWFGADGTVLKRPRDPGEAPESLTDVSERIRALVAAADPDPVTRTELRRALRLPVEILNTACTIGANRGRIVSTTAGYVLGDGQTVEGRARDLAGYVNAAAEPVSVRQLAEAFDLTEASIQRAVRHALDRGWIEDRRGGGRGGLVASAGWQTAA